jgi:hypothetical protein
MLDYTKQRGYPSYPRSIRDAAEVINDAGQLKSIIKTRRQLEAASEDEKADLKNLLKAQVRNLTDENSAFVCDLLVNNE